MNTPYKFCGCPQDLKPYCPFWDDFLEKCAVYGQGLQLAPVPVNLCYHPERYTFTTDFEDQMNTLMIPEFPYNAGLLMQPILLSPSILACQLFHSLIFLLQALC